MIKSKVEMFVYVYLLFTDLLTGGNFVISSKSFNVLYYNHLNNTFSQIVFDT